MNQDWLFLGKVSQQTVAGHEQVAEKVTLPHCVAKLSWQAWDPDSWEDIWLYRRHVRVPQEFRGKRIFVKFEAMMTTADVSINGVALPTHRGGYLPFSHEITHALKDGDNVLEVKVDSRFLNVPPAGSPKGPHAVDYYLPGGIIRGASLIAVPDAYISDVFAKPVDVLQASRRVEVTCSVDCASAVDGPAYLEAVLLDGSRVVASARRNVTLSKANTLETTLTLTGLDQVKLWDVEAPQLYEVSVTLNVGGEARHKHRSRIGLREARFTVDGFFLNGKRLRLFGLDRHELYPYVGYAMPERVMRRDAEILRNEFHCNIVRCSHYPQSAAFLDACDELGLMVWEETPGWQYIGDADFQDQVVENVGDMIRRDRNRPSVVIWGVRVNESRNEQPLYRRTTALAKSLDDSRPTSGSMTTFDNWQTDWHEDVFAMDDYHQSPDGTVQIYPPLPGVPYMLAETVGQRTYTKKGFDNMYRRAGDVAVQCKQALYHAQAHDKALGYPRFNGVIAWCAFEYGSPQNSYKGIKNPGVADVFRAPKLGASFYQAQVDPRVKPVIIPNFYWDFGKATPRGPGKGAAIFSNCERLEIFVGGKPHSTTLPDRKNYPNLRYAPSLVDLELDGANLPELRIDGYVENKKILSRRFSADSNKDQFIVEADDASILDDGSDATRVLFQVTDQFGAPRLFAGGDVTFSLSGPGILVGDPVFSLTESGGVGAVWIKSVPGTSGKVRLQATHSSLGSRSVEIAVTRKQPPIKI
ncbi:MAG: glycoside hydrolase family 2 protein [Acidobacteriaceae bacterium]